MCHAPILGLLLLESTLDDQAQIRVRLETEAVLAIIGSIAEGQWTMLSSEALEFELRQIPNPQRRQGTFRLLSVAQERVGLNTTIEERANT